MWLFNRSNNNKQMKKQKLNNIGPAKSHESRIFSQLTLFRQREFYLTHFFCFCRLHIALYESSGRYETICINH